MFVSLSQMKTTTKDSRVRSVLVLGQFGKKTGMTDMGILVLVYLEQLSIILTDKFCLLGFENPLLLT